MGTEIERKFLVTDTPWIQSAPSMRMKQGYLSTEPERTVRVRLVGSKGILTIKGRTVGARRAEFEYPIPVADAEALLQMCVPPLIEKVRYRVEHAGHTWDVDLFEGLNAGLRVAEVELAHEDEAVSLPDWVGAEVTDDPAYYNSRLSIRPYTTWSTS